MLPFLIAALVVAAKAIHDSNQEMSERDSDAPVLEQERREDSRSAGVPDSFDGIQLRGEASHRAKVIKALEFYREDPEEYKRLKRHVNAIDCDLDGYMGKSTGRGLIRLNPRYNPKTIAGTAAHEVGHEESWDDDTEDSAEAAERRFWAGRRR